jgi:mannose-1-phosphate guanylyltransferase
MLSPKAEEEVVMDPAASAWALVLAGGEGSRVRSLTRRDDGTVVPKQFCSLAGGRSLLELALARAGGLVRSDQILSVVLERHRLWWEEDLATLPTSSVLIQPRNRGTLSGLLLPLLEVCARDGDPTVVVVPSDHHVREEPVLEEAVWRALSDSAQHPDAVVLVGMEPGVFDPDYGWIVPGEQRGDRLYGVRSFHEKPDRTYALKLVVRGGVWNSFILVARARVLLERVEAARPGLIAMVRAVGWKAGRAPSRELGELYESLDEGDFCREVVQPWPGSLLVRTAPPCGWSDLGTPERVARCLPVATSPGASPDRPVLTRSLHAWRRPPVEVPIEASLQPMRAADDWGRTTLTVRPPAF